MRESLGATKPKGAMKVKAGSLRGLRCDPAIPVGGRNTGPSRGLRP